MNRLPVEGNAEGVFNLRFALINRSEAITFEEEFNMGLDRPFNMYRRAFFASERIQC
jgi:hypothetical protein